MIIALFSDVYTPDINGVATSTYILKQELMKLGHQVVVVTTELPSNSDYQDEDDNILRVPGLELKALYGFRAASMYSFKGMHELKRMNIDIIHVQTEFGIGIFGRIAGQTLNVPVVYTYHTMYEDYSHYVNPTSSSTIDGIVKKAIGRISKLYGDNCNELIVPSLKTKEALEKYGLVNQNTHIIPTGLQLENFDPKNKSENIIESLKKEYHLNDKFVVTFLGRIAPEKSIEVVIEAIKEVVKTNKHVVLLIVGGGPQLEELQQLVKDDKIEDLVIFTGPQSAGMVPSFYHLSDVFVSASLSETQGLTYIEAMASGTPVIARYDEQLKDVIDDNVNGYFFRDTNKLPELINGLVGKDLSSMQEAAYKKAQQFSGEEFARRVLEVYEIAIKNKNYTYKIKQIIPTNNNRNEVVMLIDGLSVSIELTDKIIEQYNLKEDQFIDHDTFETLKDFEQVTKCYNKALKILTYKDYTYQQLRKKLMNSGDYDDTQLDATMDLLCEKNLVNDEAFALNYLKRCTRLGIGLNKAIYNLRTYEISDDLIDQCLESLNDDEEYIAATNLISTYFKRNSGFNSQKQVINKIKQKLFIKGFTSETIDRAMNDYDYQYDESIELEALEKEFVKLYTRYSKRMSGEDLKNKLIDSLLKKGYNYEHIKEVINKGDYDNE